MGLLCLSRGATCPIFQVTHMALFLIVQAGKPADIFWVFSCRSLCFKCLSQLVISSLARNASPSCSPQVVAWLDKIVKPGLVNARKGGISMQEQQVGASTGCSQALQYRMLYKHCKFAGLATHICLFLAVHLSCLCASPSVLLSVLVCVLPDCLLVL